MWGQPAPAVQAQPGKLYFFGGTVNPKIEIFPDPATLRPPDSSGFGK
jgi:hypothetical protein